MTTPERKQARGELIEAAQAITAKLEAGLRDETAQGVTLSRKEAAIAIGLLVGAAQALEREADVVERKRDNDT